MWWLIDPSRIFRVAGIDPCPEEAEKASRRGSERRFLAGEVARGFENINRPHQIAQ